MSQLLTMPEVSARIRVPVATLRFWRLKGVGPSGFKVGRRVMYRVDVVDDWLAVQERMSIGSSSDQT